MLTMAGRWGATSYLDGWERFSWTAMKLGYQVKAQPPFEVCLADWSWTPFGVRANLHRDPRNCKSYNFKL